jgi:4-alpha-glucanotransferase
VYQSSAIIPHWHVTADEHGHWDVRLNWSLDSYSQSNPREKRGAKIATAAST